MKQENDEYLCKVYPKMMVNRNKDMTEYTIEYQCTTKVWS